MNKANIITVGDELLIGQVIDTNSAWMGSSLAEIGIEVNKIISIQDNELEIKKAVDQSFQEVEIILMTGGLGPTKDDITKKCLVEYFGDELYFDEALYNQIQRFFNKLGRQPLEAHRLQCYMPKRAEILRNKMGTAPGMLFKQENKILVSMPGVPYEMKSIFRDELLPILKSDFIEGSLYNRTIRTIGRGESDIAQRIDEVVNKLPPHIKLAFLPGLGQVRLRLSGKGDNYENLKAEVESYVSKIEQTIPELIFGYDEDTLEKVIGDLLVEKNLKVAFAESCTGGYVSHLITSIPGSSKYLEGSFVTYSYDLKQKLLDVQAETLNKFGAVSEETVVEMVAGCLKKTAADVAVAISGIAGPEGGTPDKPVGTIWLALSNGTQTITKKLSLGNDRTKNIKYTATHALNLLRKFVIGED